MSSAPLQWYCEPFEKLSLPDLYGILQLRSEVFVVEQNCVYQDCDGKDEKAFHLFAKHNGVVVCYTRLLPPGVSFPNVPSIGRVLVKKTYRSSGLGNELMKKSIQKVAGLFGSLPIKIAAQVYLTHFYSALGFEAEGAPYDEDGIPHILMTLKA